MKDLSLPLNKLVSFASDNRLIFVPAALLLGRTEMGTGLFPFGFAFYAASAGILPGRLLLAVAVIAGAATKGNPEQVYINIGGILLFYVFSLFFKKAGRSQYALSAFLGIILPMLVMTGLQGFLTYDLIRTAFFGFIIMIGYFIFRHSLTALIMKKGRRAFSNEETICIVISAGLVASGLVGDGEAGIIIKDVLCLAIIMFSGYKAGPGVGTAAGVALGLSGSVSSELIPLSIGIYAFCGFISGIMKDRHKAVAVLGFVAANIVLALYLREITSPYDYLLEISIAAVIFLVLPKKQLDAAESIFLGEGGFYGELQHHPSRVRDYTVGRLEKFSGAFRKLSKSFNEITQVNAISDQQEISVLLDKAADRVCRDCSLCYHCWELNFINTYQVMFKIIENLDQKGRIEKSDIPAYFLDRCERAAAFVDAVNNAYELFKVDLLWKGRIGESRGLISRQYESLSEAISSLADEIKTEISFMEEIEDGIVTALKGKGIEVREASAFENRLGRYEVEVIHSGCGGTRNCISVIEKTVSSATGRRMYPENEECRKSTDGCCALKLHEGDNFRVTTGIARVARHESKVSGDSFTFLNTGAGKYIIALSDGMGSGYKAAAQSRTTVTLLENFLESGFSKDMAVNLINSVLVLKSGDDTYSTIDISVIDLYSGEVEFVKTGAAPTYIRREDRVEMIRKASLPAGILGDVETELMHRKVAAGEMIIMTSDGVTDSFAGDRNGERELSAYIRGLRSMNPQEVADEVLREAERRSNGMPEDDMTVIVAKVWN